MSDELDILHPGRVVNVAGNAAFTSRLKPRARVTLTPEQKLWADATQAAVELNAIGVAPTIDNLAGRLRGKWARKSLLELLATEKWANAMVRRGVPWNAETDTLTPLQQSFLQLYFDTATPATHSMKLRQANVTSQMFTGWLRQPVFAREMERMRQLVLKDGLHLATQRLVELADGGDLKAIDRVMAFNGEDFRTLTGEDVNALLSVVFEVLDEERVDSAIMTKLSLRIKALHGGPGATMTPVAPVYQLPTEER